MAKASGERIGEDSIQKFITSRTLEGLTEGDINKISVSRVDKIGDLSKLKKISKNRGTSVENLIEYYNLNDVKRTINFNSPKLHLGPILGISF